MHARQLALHQRKAGTGNLGRSGKIEQAHGLADIHVILDRKIEAARGSPALDLDVGGLVLAHRHALVRQVRDCGHNRFHLRQQFSQTGFTGFQIGLECRDLRHHLTGILALAFQHADLLRKRIALGLQFLRLRLQRLALRFKGLEFRKVESLATSRQSLGDGIEVVAQKLNVEHVETSGISGGHSCGESADYTRGGLTPFLRP